MLAAHGDSRPIGSMLAKARFDYDMVEFDDLMKDVSSILDIDTNALASYVADDSNLTYHIRVVLGNMQSSSNDFFDLEMPLIRFYRIWNVLGYNAILIGEPFIWVIQLN